MRCGNNIIQPRERVQAYKLYRTLSRLLWCIRSFCCLRGGSFRPFFFRFLWKILKLGFTELLEDIDDIVSAIDLYGIGRFVALEGCKFGKTCIQFFRIFHFSDNEDNTFGIDRNSLDHQRNIICFKTKLYLCLLHHITKETFGFFGTVCKFADTDLMTVQIFFRQGTADLIFIDFFYFHMITSYR